MTDKEKKKWILQRWNVMDGRKIAEVTKRYFQTYKKVPYRPNPSIVEEAKEIFSG